MGWYMPQKEKKKTKISWRGERIDKRRRGAFAAGEKNGSKGKRVRGVFGKLKRRRAFSDIGERKTGEENPLLPSTSYF